MDSIKLTRALPKTPGYYWWTNFGEHTPTIVEVKKSGDTLYANNEEFSFEVTKEEPAVDAETVFKKYRYGDELWGKIPLPSISGEIVEPDSF